MRVRSWASTLGLCLALNGCDQGASRGAQPPAVEADAASVAADLGRDAEQDGASGALRDAAADRRARANGLDAGAAGRFLDASYEAARPPMLGEAAGDATTPASDGVVQRDAGLALSAPPDPAQMGYDVVVDRNVGRGFEVPIDQADQGDGTGVVCATFVQSFGQEPRVAAEFAKLPASLDMALHSLYRPAVLDAGRKYPLLVWGNGTCAYPEAYGPVLRHLAGQGFFVVAAHSRWVNANMAMRKSLDWALSVHADRSSPYYGTIDTEQIGAFGHGQGALAAVALASDARIRAVLLFNGATTAPKPGLFVTADRNMDPLGTVESVRGDVNAAQQAAFVWYHNVPATGGEIDLNGHLLVLLQPERVLGPTAAWFRLLLQRDAVARAWFVGADCKLCNKQSDFTYGQHGLDDLQF